MNQEGQHLVKGGRIAQTLEFERQNFPISEPSTRLFI